YAAVYSILLPSESSSPRPLLAMQDVLPCSHELPGDEQTPIKIRNINFVSLSITSYGLIYSFLPDANTNI
uniref:Uncharacterized protein n=1 Tax=Cairina moschata TaxID=8855 RepID=A0A8C3CPU4_CAIMO